MNNGLCTTFPVVAELSSPNVAVSSPLATYVSCNINYNINDNVHRSWIF